MVLQLSREGYNGFPSYLTVKKKELEELRSMETGYRTDINLMVKRVKFFKLFIFTIEYFDHLMSQKMKYFVKICSIPDLRSELKQ